MLTHIKVRPCGCCEDYRNCEMCPSCADGYELCICEVADVRYEDDADDFCLEEKKY